jgi:hypothetical protein
MVCAAVVRLSCYSCIRTRVAYFISCAVYALVRCIQSASCVTVFCCDGLGPRLILYSSGFELFIYKSKLADSFSFSYG